MLVGANYGYENLNSTLICYGVSTIPAVALLFSTIRTDMDLELLALLGCIAAVGIIPALLLFYRRSKK